VFDPEGLVSTVDDSAKLHLLDKHGLRGLSFEKLHLLDKHGLRGLSFEIAGNLLCWQITQESCPSF